MDNDDGHMGNENKRRRRQAEADPLGDFDIEENFDPPVSIALLVPVEE